MKNLFNKLFNRSDEKKPVVERTFDADAIKPIFKQYGIDIDKEIGGKMFPAIEYRNHPSSQFAYDVLFNDVTIIPALIDGKMSTIITGKYRSQALESGFLNEWGNHQRAEPSYYDFTIQDGKLNLKRKN